MRRRNSVKVLIPLIALLICGVIVLLERYGVTREEFVWNEEESINLVFSEAVEETPTCLILTNQEDTVSATYEEMMRFVLDDMRISYDVLAVTEDTSLDCLSNYQTLVLTFMDWSVIEKQLLQICDWVKAGGAMMNLCTPLPNAGFHAVAGKLGVESGGLEYTKIRGVQVVNEQMIGGKTGQVFWYSDDGEEMLETSLNLYLSDKCEVLLVSEDGSIPILWKVKYGDGTFVIFNEVITDKYQRGFACLAYSELEDVCIYPVINGSAFYLDDFPAPVPEGNGIYLLRDYGVSVASFCSIIWWPKILEWGDTYHIRYTGGIIEEYSDDVAAPFEKNKEEAQFTTFGNMLLNDGGELGFHGYNHMPLCIKGIDENQQYGEYKLWESAEDVKAAMEELYDFSSNLFPREKFMVYIPPSNIISEVGLNTLLEACPDINVIASTYFSDTEAKVFEQEFEVDEKGIIHTPRVVSSLGLTEYQKIAALAELNYHYVQSHFMHPDDLLDEDRGARTGFPVLSKMFEEYLEWIYTSAPNIRNLTGSELGTAVLKYDKLTLSRERSGNTLSVKLGGFSGSAEFLLRVNEGCVESIEGGSFERITGNLYAVHATSDKLEIILKE